MSKKLLKNISSLTIIHGFNYFLSLAIIPYLLVIYGSENWGKLVFLQTFANYFIWLTDWGFNTGGIKKISESRVSSNDTHSLFFNYWLGQWIILFFALLLMFIIVLFFPNYTYGIDKSLFTLSSLLVLSNVIFPAWYFKGLEQVMESAFFQFLPKVFNVIFILLFIKNSNDLFGYILIISVISILVAIFATIFMFYRNNMTFIRPTFKKALKLLGEDFVWVRVNSISSLSSIIIPTYLGLIGQLSELAFFNIADKIKSAAIIVLHPISHSLYPRMSYLFKVSFKEAFSLAKMSFILLFSLSGLFSIFIFIFSENILFFFGGKDFILASNFLRIISFIPLISTINNFFVEQLIIPNSDGKFIEKGNFIKFLVVCISILPLHKNYGISGIGYLLVSAEGFILFINAYKVNNLHIFLGKSKSDSN